MNFPLPTEPLEFTPVGAELARYTSFTVGGDAPPLTQEVLTALNTRPTFDKKPAPLASFQSFSATVNADDVLLPEHFSLMLFVYAKTKLQPFLQDAYNPTPAAWGGISLVRFRPAVTGAVVEDSLSVSGSLPANFPVVAALIVLRGLFSPASVHVQQSYEPGGGETPGGGGIGVG